MMLYSEHQAGSAVCLDVIQVRFLNILMLYGGLRLSLPLHQFHSVQLVFDLRFNRCHMHSQKRACRYLMTSSSACDPPQCTIPYSCCALNVLPDAVSLPRLSVVSLALPSSPPPPVMTRALTARLDSARDDSYVADTHSRLAH